MGILPALLNNLRNKNIFEVFKSRMENQPKEEVFGMDIPRTSGGQSRGYPSPKRRSDRSKSWKKNKHLGADILTRRRGRPRPFGQRNFGLNFREAKNSLK